MYFTFPSFKNIATQRSFNENIHFPLHCLKSTFSFQKSCRKSEKIIFGRSFQLSSKSIFSFQKSCRKSEKNIFGRFFQFSSNFPKSVFSLQISYRKSEKAILGGNFFNFQQNFQNPFFPFRNPAESPKN